MADRPSVRIRVIIPVLLILIMLNFLLLSRQLWPLLRSETASPGSPTADPTLHTVAGQPTATPEPVFVPTISTDTGEILRSEGIMLLSMRDGGNFHLFAYHPQYLPFSRITNGAWDDITPAISPDGTRVAFASNRGGFWDLYVLDLAANQTTQITHTPEYDGAPSWSPDGEWLAFEHYNGNNLDIFLVSVTNTNETAIPLTDSPAADYAPDWSPAGRELAFVSTRSGEEEVWLAQLDNAENRFANLSADTNSSDTHPSWSPDGSYLIWTQNRGGTNAVSIWNRAQPDASAEHLDYPLQWTAWSPDGQKLLGQVISANEQGLMIYQREGTIHLPLTLLPGYLKGIDWQSGTFPALLLPLLAQNANHAAADLWQTNLTRFPIQPAGRFAIVPAGDIAVPFPFLHDAVNESFDALRQDIASRAGWDFLANLENAFIPITQPSEPGMEENWLYTGRAFAANTVLLHAGWMAVVREDTNGQTFWRVYLKARFQDGSQGLPMKQRPWNLEARYQGDPRIYEQGGVAEPIPAGYWIDFTELASRYGWSRLPALINWRTFFPAARFNQFVLASGMDWQTAIQEIYPPEILQTPTSAPKSIPAAPAPQQKP